MPHPDEAKASLASPAMTNAQYVEAKGMHCPFCNASDIEGGSIDIDAGYATQDVSCHDCQRAWTDRYQLIGY